MAFMRLFVLLIVVTGHFAASAKPKSRVEVQCQNGLSTTWFDREFSMEAPDWSDDMGIIQSNMEAMAWSTVRTYFSKEWDTQVYFTATGIPDTKDFKIPLVDKDCAAVAFFVHGSGTVKSSGANFIANMSQLSNLGYCAVSIDMPFHGSGSLRNGFNDVNTFMEYIKKIVEHIKSYGKPVYMAGHSFGPDVIFELISRYPNLIAGALAMSPAPSSDPVLEDWYKNNTSKMKFGGTVMTNTPGSEWSGVMASKFTWANGSRPDPTVVNPDLYLNILYGDREEYYPAPVGGPNRTPIGKNTYDVSKFLLKHFANARITVAEGVGHYLFDHRDANGDLVAMRELVKMMGGNIRDAKAMMALTGKNREARGAANKLAWMAKFDYVFQAWFKTKYNERLALEILKNQDQNRAQSILLEYAAAYEAKIRSIMDEVELTQQTDVVFYLKHSKQIEAAKSKKRIDMGLIVLYYLHKGGTPVTIN